MSVNDAPCHERYALGLQNCDRVLAYGPPGVGKTHAAVEEARRREQEYIKITCTDGDMSAEYRGMWIPSKGGIFEFVLGVATKAWCELNGGKGGLLLLDEIDHAPPEVHSLLHAILDDRGLASLTLPNGRSIKPGEWFWAVGTMNGKPDDLTPALKDRFDVKVRVDTPPHAAMERLPDRLRLQAEFLIGHPDDSVRVSYRSIAAFARLSPKVGEEMAAQLVFDSERWSDILTALRLSA